MPDVADDKPLCESCGRSIEKVRQMLKCQCTEIPLSVAIDDEEVPDHWPLLDVLEYYKG